MHRNFKSANLLLDDRLEAHVSDCGLAPLLPSVSVSQVVLFVRERDYLLNYNKLTPNLTI